MSTTPQPPTITIAFDLYGTILSTSSISTVLADLLDITPEKAVEVAELWRRHQLEYTWRSNCMKKYQSFDKLTLSSLHHALAQNSIPIPTTSFRDNDSNPTTFTTKILNSYNTLTPFPDALSGLSLLTSTSTSTQTISPYIFSNGTISMISSSLTHSLTSSMNPFITTAEKKAGEEKGEDDRLNRLISIDSMVPQPLYKPAPEAYHYLLERIGNKTNHSSSDHSNNTLDEDLGGLDNNENANAGQQQVKKQQFGNREEMGSVWLVSSNPFDIVGAKNVGLRTAWVDRSGVGWVDALADGGGEEDGEGGMPDLAVDGVDDAITGILKFEDERGGKRREEWE